MGDRANVAILDWRDEASPTFIYTHWGGYKLPEDVHRALAKRWRWNDNSYLTRIVFDEVCPERGEETGFGISSTLTDNEYDVIVLDPNRQAICTVAPGVVAGIITSRGVREAPGANWVPFEQFVEREVPDDEPWEVFS